MPTIAWNLYYLKTQLFAEDLVRFWVNGHIPLKHDGEHTGPPHRLQLRVKIGAAAANIMLCG